MSVNECDMDTNELDDAESRYFQEMNIYDETPDQTSGSFQGSFAIPTFSLDSSSSRENEGCQVTGQPGSRMTLSLQGSQGFQTLNQSTLPRCQWQPVGLDTGQVKQEISDDQRVAMDIPVFEAAASNFQNNSTFARTNMQVKDNENFLLINVVMPDFSTNKPYNEATDVKALDKTNRPVAYVATDDVNEPESVPNVSGSSGTDSSGQGHETRSPKRRQRKSRPASHQGSELQAQKTESGRPSVSPNKGEHGSDGQGGSELSFKPSLLEEILTEKKLALMRSPEVMQFLQSQQRTRQKNIVHDEHTENVN